jgi:hypothetical protein
LRPKFTAIPYREVQGPHREIPDPCNENRVPCNKNRLFPARIDLQGVLYRSWVCSVVTLAII